jgi:hypothetical protein
MLTLLACRNFFGLDVVELLIGLSKAVLSIMPEFLHTMIVSRIPIGFFPIVFARITALWWKTCECIASSLHHHYHHCIIIASS